VIVCVCRNVSDRAIGRAIEAGARTAAEVSRATGAGTGCGCCRGTIEAMLEGGSAAAGSGCAACPRRAAATKVEAP
jgi:bacterioferritin-associated ferredoxin